jgi:competence ComEA-like helix-hairpin-helix protein
MVAASANRNVVIYGTACILQRLRRRQGKKGKRKKFGKISMEFAAHRDSGAAWAALLCGGLLLAWQVAAAFFAWWQPAQQPLFATCENQRLLLSSTAKTGAGDNLACQPFVSRLIAINQANAGALAAVPGIGASTANKLVEYREKNGKFRSAADLTQVSGIGQRKSARFAEYLSFE